MNPVCYELNIDQIIGYQLHLQSQYITLCKKFKNLFCPNYNLSKVAISNLDDFNNKYMGENKLQIIELDNTNKVLLECNAIVPVTTNQSFLEIIGSIKNGDIVKIYSPLYTLMFFYFYANDKLELLKMSKLTFKLPPHISVDLKNIMVYCDKQLRNINLKLLDWELVQLQKNIKKRNGIEYSSCRKKYYFVCVCNTKFLNSLQKKSIICATLHLENISKLCKMYNNYYSTIKTIQSTFNKPNRVYIYI